MENIKPTSGGYFKALTIVFYGLIAGQMAFGLLSIFVVNAHMLDSQRTDLSEVFMIVVPILALGGFFASYLMFKSRLKAIDRESGFEMKLNDYRAALIVRYALLEGPCLFAITIYLLTGNMVFILLAACIILYFLTLRPSKEKAIRDLELNSKEEEMMDDPNREI